MKAIGYARTSTQRQDLSLEVQEKRISLECEIRGLELEMISEKVSASLSPLERDGLSQALASLRNGEADMLIVAKLDRVARSLSDIATLLETSRKEGWSFVALDLGVDTSSPEGTLVVGIMASIAQWERARIQERTREALAQIKESGRKLGRPRLHSPLVQEKARNYRQAGLSLNKIAIELEREGFVASTGKRISPSSVLRLLEVEDCK
jgi:DNA invertase Pin-like site-specific DNA recombinase